MITLFKIMVLPIIKYCCQLWNPTNIGQIRKIEAVQRAFTIKLQNIDDLNYWDRLKYLKFYSLERRKEIFNNIRLENHQPTRTEP